MHIITDPCEFESRSGRGVQHYVMKFVSDLRQVYGFLRIFRFPSPNKTDRHDIAEIFLKVVLNTIKQTNKHTATVPNLPPWYFPTFLSFGL